MGEEPERGEKSTASLEEPQDSPSAKDGTVRMTAPAPPTSFSRCQPPLSQEILQVVDKMGFQSMTPVQVCLRSV